MKNRWERGIILTIVFALTFCFSINLSRVLSTPSNLNLDYAWDIPAWIPKPVIPADNPMTKEKVKLGRHLFYEKRLSVNKQFSCASCHIQAFAFSDPKPVAVGATGEKHPRNSMTLANVAYNSVLTWAHPGMILLEIQAIIPMFGEIPVEMGLTDKEKVVQMLREDVNYQKMFAAAFDKGDENITLNNLTKALASFQRSFISANSPYDNYRYGGKINAISAAAKRGKKLFNSERLHCSQCHSGFNFSDSIKYKKFKNSKNSKNSNVEKINFHNTGLYNIDEKGSYPANNTGVHGITNKPNDMGKFKVPTLRNIALTAPYMHDGSIATLEEVIDHYAAGGRTIYDGKYAGIGSKNSLKSKFITGFKLSSKEKKDLLEFLQSLTDKSFITNPAFSDPNQR